MNWMQKDQSAGFTLIELMIALAITGILSAAMYSVFTAQVRGQVSQDVSLRMTQGVRNALNLLAADIRMAGCDPTQDADAGIVTADSGELRITMDIGGVTDGEPNGEIETNEDIRYAINTSGNLGREVGGAGGLQPLHSVDLACDVLNFVYLDSDGSTITTPVADTDEINAIQVSIIIRSADTTNPGLLRSHTDNTRYRNLQGTQILAPPGDKFRRFQLSETIDCRNL